MEMVVWREIRWDLFLMSSKSFSLAGERRDENPLKKFSTNFIILTDSIMPDITTGDPQQPT